MALRWLGCAALLHAVRVHGQSHVAWSTTASGGGPGGRAHAAMTPHALGDGNSPVSDVLYMFGGISNSHPVQYSDELWSYAAGTGAWTQRTNINAPSPRIGSAMCSIGHTLFLYGGKTMDLLTSDQLYYFDTAIQRWEHKIIHTGFQPSARKSHAMSCVGTDVYVFGGTDALGAVQQTMYQLVDAIGTTTHWQDVALSGSPPTKRKGHTLTHFNGRLYLFGGQGSISLLNDAYAFDVSTGEWVSLTTSGDTPTARSEHTAAVLDQRLYVFGGTDSYEELNDVAMLDLQSLRWASPRSSGTPPVPRAGHTAALVNGIMYMFGGISATSSLLDDAWTMSRECLGTVELTATRATFMSGDGPYRPNTLCTWHIRPAAQHRQTRLYFTRFELEDGADFVRVYDGDDATHGTLAVLSGSSLPPPLVSTNGSLTLVMSSDVATHKAGFSASYYAECAEGFHIGSTTLAGDDYCYPCVTGHYASHSGLAECLRCPRHQYQDEYGQARCKDCPAASRAPFEGAVAAAQCACYPGFFAPNGSGTDCVACPTGATCPGNALSTALALPGYCRVSNEAMAPCCDASDCPGGSEATCPTAAGAIGSPGALKCDEFTLLTLPRDTFIIVAAVVFAVSLITFGLGCWQGRKRGVRQALRDMAFQLKATGLGPQPGSEIVAYQSTADASLESAMHEYDDWNGDLDGDIGLGGASMDPLADTTRALPSCPSRPAMRESCHFAPSVTKSDSARGSARMRPAAAAGAGVGCTVVDLEDVKAAEAHCVPPSPSAHSKCSSQHGSKMPRKAATPAVPELALSRMQAAEGNIFPPSTCGGASRPQTSALGSESAYEEEFGTAAPPTPPRAARSSDLHTSAPDYTTRRGAGAVSLTIPDQDGRWAPVNYSESMANSPQGSVGHPSLAPTESVYGGARSVRSVGGRSIGGRSTY